MKHNVSNFKIIKLSSGQPRLPPSFRCGGQGYYARGGAHTHSSQFPGSILELPSALNLQVKTQLQAQTVATMAVGHQHQHQVRYLPRDPGLQVVQAQWLSSDPYHLLLAGCPECPGDHLAPTGHAGAVAGCGWGCAPSHSRFSCPAGHLYLCQGLGTGSTGKELGTLTLTGNGRFPASVTQGW